MEKLVICGNGGLLQYVKKAVERDGCRVIQEIVDNIADAASIKCLETSDIFLAVSWHETEAWIHHLRNAGAKTIYRIPVFTMQYKLPIIQNGELIPKTYAKVSTDSSDLLYLETHVADTCNLKCRGCMHFSNIAIHPNYPDLQEFERDFSRLSELFSNIFIIRLMGGEPLLNPKLHDYIKIARQYFPAAELRIVTNGLLIPKQPDDLWEVMRKCHAAMDISPYPPTMEKIEELIAKLDKEGIPYGTIAEELQNFRKSLTLSPNHNLEKAVRLCGSAHCRFLRNGKIAKCPLPLLIEDFNHEYGCTIESKDIYDIYAEQSGAALKEKLEQYADMCRYCPDEAVFIPWQRTRHDARMEDWVAE